MSARNVLRFPIEPRPIPARDPDEAARKAIKRSYRTKLLREAEGKAAASNADPILAAIFAHLTAVAAYLDHSDKSDETRAGKRLSEYLMNACDEPLMTVLTTQPTTWAGVIALLEHVARPEFLYESELDYESGARETFLTTYNECIDGETKRIGQDFPLRVAETIRRRHGATYPHALYSLLPLSRIMANHPEKHSMAEAPETPDQKMDREYHDEMRELELIEEDFAYGVKRGSNKPTSEALRAALDSLKQGDEAPTGERLAGVSNRDT